LSIDNNTLSSFGDEDAAVDLLHQGDMLDLGALRGIESKNERTRLVGSDPAVSS
jgi:hypothetical protein